MKDEINEANAAYMFSYAFILEAERLQKDLEKIIMEKILNKNNCTQFYLESIKFKSPTI